MRERGLRFGTLRYKEMSLSYTCRVEFQHDGAILNKTPNVRVIPTTEFSQQMIGYADPVEWPPLSLNSSPIVF